MVTRQPKCRFLHGVFYAPSFSKATVPKLQTVFMADACHLNFGKYTMFLCYGVTANSNMSVVGFAIIFGNENTLGWKEFWQFILCTHPSIDRGDITIISNQDKGIKSTIKDVLQSVGHFFCSWHRRKNIILVGQNKIRHNKPTMDKRVGRTKHPRRG